MSIKLKVESNLQHIALIRVAANIWLSRPMITKISNFVTENNFKYKSPSDKLKIKIREWLTDIFEQVNSSMKLPYAIKNDLLYVIKPVGKNLLDYLARHTSTNWGDLFREQSFPGLDVYCKHIEFDCFGKVDEVKTFLNIYNANGNFSLVFFFYEACTYCLEDLIFSIWKKCSEQMKFEIKHFLTSTADLYDNMHIMQQYWMQIVDKNPLKLPYKITEIDALEYCVQEAHTVSVKYIINKFSQDDKNKIIVPLAQKLIQHRFDRYPCFGIPWLILKRQFMRHMTFMNPCQKPNQHTCNLFYLLSQITENDKIDFSTLRTNSIILLSIKEWPWKYLLLNLNYSDKVIYRWLIKTIVETIVDDYNFYKKIVYTDLWMIPEIWKKCPDNFETSIVEICWSIEEPIMFKLQAVILVTSVIDDTDGVNKLRSEIYKGFEIHCNEFVDKQNYEVVDLFLKNILQSDEESKLIVVLSHSKNICCRLLLSKYFDKFDKFLSWRFHNDDVQI